jgi:ribosomal protein L25 (general stress protein Ctc)
VRAAVSATSGKTPGIVYGGEGQPQLIELDHNALWHALKKEAFHSTILEMELAGKTSKVLLRDVQYTRTASWSSTSTSSAWTPTPACT